MLYVIFGKDKKNSSSRLDNYDAHKAYLSNSPVKIVFSGPLVDDKNRDSMIGSLFLIDAENIEQVQDFNRNDPFYKAGVWEHVFVEPFFKRMGADLVY
jgi:uncharacterized protein